MELSTDRNTVRLHIEGVHNAAQVESLIRTLALMRTDMLPGVPVDKDKQDKGGANAIVEKQPMLTMVALRSGGFRLWLRNRGFGWLAYEIDDRAATSMRNLISKHTKARETADFADTLSP